MKKLILAILILTVCCFSECKKEHDPTKNATLPAATQEGKNTIGFSIDGAVWVPYAKCGGFRNPCEEILARYGESGGAAPNGIDFGFTRQRNNTQSSLFISSPFHTITSIGEKVDSITVTFVAENHTGNNGYFTGPMNGSKFYITKIDFSLQVISGEFQLVLLEQNGSGNTITLKEGRFDFRLNACKCSN